MKYLIASDIHGSSLFCEKLLALGEKEAAEGIILLGDILYHGPRNDLPELYAPKKVINMLNPLKDRLLCVRGNCDAEVDQMVLDFDISTEHRLTELGGTEVFLTHGHHINPDKPPESALIKSAGFVLFGHTHIPFKEKRNGVYYLNPGSVSIPKAGSAHSCIVFDGTEFIWKTLDGEIYDRLKV